MPVEYEVATAERHDSFGTTPVLTSTNPEPYNGKDDHPMIPRTPPETVTAPIFSLRAKYEQLSKKLYKDLPVARWRDVGLEIYVRYGPIDTTHLERSVRSRRESKVDNWNLLSSADAMANSCIGVYAIDEGKEISLRDGDPDGPWTRFDADLGYSLGMIPGTTRAADVVKKLYMTDGDLLSTFTKLAEWSGIAVDGADSDFLGV